MTTRKGRQQWRSRQRAREAKAWLLPECHPETIAEAVLVIVGALSPLVAELVESLPVSSMDGLLRPRLSREISLRFGLKDDNEALRNACGCGVPISAKECSMLIIEQVWGWYHPEVYCVRCPWKGMNHDTKGLPTNLPHTTSRVCPTCNSPVSEDKNRYMQLFPKPKPNV